MAQSDVKLKLMIDTKSQRVLFGEADKKFIDFLFDLLSLPLGSVIKLLEHQTMIGESLGNVYKSLETLSDTYLQANKNKDAILKPRVSICGSTIMLLSPTTFYLCISTHFGKCRRYVSDGPNAICPKCNSNMDQMGTYVKPPIASTVKSVLTLYFCISTMTSGCRYFVSDGPDAICPCCNYYMTQMGTYVKPSSATKQPEPTNVEDEGYVKGVVTYMVMDDLTVKPMSTISSLTLFNKFNITEMGDLEEKLITLNGNEGVKLLRASLESKTVLTDVFMGKKEL